MSLAIVHCRAQVGVNAPRVRVETHIANGLPAFTIVGLAELAVRESRERVRSAIVNSGWEFPARRITVNLAPADLPKQGTRFDLAIALGILAASGQLPAAALDRCEAVAELALDGTLRSVPGMLPVALASAAADAFLLLATGNAAEAALVADARVHAAESLTAVCAHLDGRERLPLTRATAPAQPRACRGPDLREVHGLLQARRALEIAAAGSHNLLLFGPPGTGKSMLATRLPELLPDMSEHEAFESAVVHSVAGRELDPHNWRRRPFRSPHHSCSHVALVGGGSSPRPGEISLAHNGVLFLDELPEFDRRAIEVLRQPLEAGRVTISRAARQMDFPAAFQLVCAMNPCPCGYLGDADRACHCSPRAQERYLARISGPLLDRIDIQVGVQRQPNWLNEPVGNRDRAPEDSGTVRHRVTAARALQQDRQGEPVNARLTTEEIERHARPTPSARTLLAQATARWALSPRAWQRAVKVALTIADLAGADQVDEEHVAEALALRQFDRARAEALRS